MGVVSSCCLPPRSCECRKSNGTRGPKRHRRNLSATFNMSVIDKDQPNELFYVDINSASEEELMTLKGIDRITAKNIIDYRNHIKGFRCVEDIALVTGVGAVKYVQIRDDIYIPTADNGLQGSDTSSPTKDNGGGEGNVFRSSQTILNVNSASVFNLITVKGISMNVAKNIVDYREQNGKFDCLDGLKKVKGVSPSLLDNIRSRLTVNVSEDKKLEKNGNRSRNYSNNNNNSSSIVQSNGKAPSHDTKDGRVLNEGKAGLSVISSSQEYERRSVSSIENLMEILGPLAAVPVRRKSKGVPLVYNGKDVFRIASWNLQKLTLEKAMNPGVKDVVCMTILENGFGIVAVQEICDTKALYEICQELVTPTLPNVRKWKGRRGKWKCVVSSPNLTDSTGDVTEKLHGFLYDESQGIELVSSTLQQLQQQLTDTSQLSFGRPFISHFKIKGSMTCWIVSVLFNETQSGTEEGCNLPPIQSLAQAVKQFTHDKDDIIIVGDARANASLQSTGFTPCLSPDTIALDRCSTNTDQAQGKTGDRKTVECDSNIWVTPGMQKLVAGESGVVRDGLYSPWIPKGWSWGGNVSDHCPVYTQLFAHKD